jgi:hypothetical protein
LPAGGQGHLQSVERRKNAMPTWLLVLIVVLVVLALFGGVGYYR